MKKVINKNCQVVKVYRFRQTKLPCAWCQKSKRVYEDEKGWWCINCEQSNKPEIYYEELREKWMTDEIRELEEQTEV